MGGVVRPTDEMDGVTAADVVTQFADAEDGVVAVFQAEYDRVVRLAYVLVADAHVAEELAQEAFVRLWRHWRRLRDQEAAPGYVKQTVVNLARSRLRRRVLEVRHRVRAHEEGLEPDVAGRLDMVQALQALTPRQRECLALRYYEDLTVDETAEVLGVTPGTVKSQTHKALRRLEEVLGDDDGTP